MSVREASASNFARNLATLCERAESIAAVCRATGINRQQFNRYLAGDTIPSIQNRRKICRHFKITESDLFRTRAGFRPLLTGAKVQSVGRQSPWSHGELGAVLKLLYSDTRPSIAPGMYFLNFEEIKERNSVLRSTLIVRTDENLTTFRRLTGLSEKQGSWWGQFHGDHRGVVVERAHWLYFVGLNARGVREPSMLVLRWLPGAYPMLGGHALVNAAGGPRTIAVVASACRKNMSLRAAIRASHIYSPDDPEIDPLILEELEEQSKILAAKARRPDLRVRRRERAQTA